MGTLTDIECREDALRLLAQRATTEISRLLAKRETQLGAHGVGLITIGPDLQTALVFDSGRIDAPVGVTSFLGIPVQMDTRLGDEYVLWQRVN